MAISSWNQWPPYLRWWRSYRVRPGGLRVAAWLVMFSLLIGVGNSDIAFAMDVAGEPDALGQEPTVLLAVGDIADCNVEGTHHVETSALVDTLKGPIAILGDIGYPNGSPENFADCYDPAWGRHTARTRPVPGNHEYVTPGASGYYSYFGAVASPLEPECVANCMGYYSYELDDWHMVALNSEVDMTAGSAQEQWLRADLDAHRTRCTLAYWHRPRFSSGVHGNDARSADVWSALYEVGVDVVLNGHEHNYERFAPQNPAGEVEMTRGIREFIVGTGGVPLRSIEGLEANSEVRENQSWGVLQLSLYPDRYAWEFMPIAGQEFVETGSAPCVEVEGDWGTKNYLPLLSGQLSGYR